MAIPEAESLNIPGTEDRLSSLPDSLLHHILSCMPVWHAVQLCVLSKRWKTLWATLPILNFCCPVPWNDRGKSDCSRMEKITKFVNTVLLLRDTTSHLHSFILDIGSDMQGELCTLLCTSIRSWIQYAVKHNLRKLHIDIVNCEKEKILLPSEVFTCSSLDHVALFIRRCLDYPGTVNLTSLKRLHLTMVDLTQDFRIKLPCSCPVLENSREANKLLGFPNITSDSSDSLKYFGIGQDHHGESVALINCPNLLSFRSITLLCHPQKGVSLNMPPLYEACIVLRDCPDCKSDMTKSRILYGLFNVYHLELKGNFEQDYLRTEISNCRTFTNLTCLSLDSLCLYCWFDQLYSLLENCPNLKKLSLVHHGCRICKNQQDKRRKQIVALFKCQKLETVEVKFSTLDRAFHWAVKNLHEAVSGLSKNVQIIMTGD